MSELDGVRRSASRLDMCEKALRTVTVTLAVDCRTALAGGYSIERVAQVSGLTVERIRELINSA